MSGEVQLPKVFKYFIVPWPLPEERNANIRAKCKLCETEISGKIKCTSNFISHLKSRHRNEHREFEEEKQEERRSRIANSANSESLPQLTERQRDASWQRMTMSLVKFLIVSLLPMSILETDAFKEMLYTFNPRYEILTRKTLTTTVLPNLERRIFTRLQSVIQEAKFCSVGMDIWTSRNKHSFLAITVHFIDNDWNLKSYVLSCAHFKGRHTGDQINRHFSKIVDKFHLSTKLFRIVTDRASNMLKATRLFIESSSSEVQREGSHGDNEETDCEFDDDSEYYDMICLDKEWLGCYAHGLQLCIREAFKMVESASTLMKKLKAAVNKIRRSSINMDVLDDVGPNVYNCIEVRWNSELRMVRSVLAIKEDVLEKILPPELMPTKEERKYLDELVMILTPLEESTDKSQSQKFVSISSVLPSSRGIKYGLRLFETSIGSDFQEALLVSFIERFDWIQSSAFLGVPPFLIQNMG